MKGFIPSGCVTCFEALSAIYNTKYNNSRGIPEHFWGIAFSSYRQRHRAKISERLAERLREAVHTLQAQICEGERVACYAGRAGLTNMDAGAFADERATGYIARGRIFPKGSTPTAGDTALFIRIEAASLAEQKRKPKRLQLARYYWSRFPQGHAHEGREWKQVCGDLEADTGGKTVALSSLKDAIRDYPSPQSLPE